MSRRLLAVCGSLQSRSANRAALDVADAYVRRFDGVEFEHADELATIAAFNPDNETNPGQGVERFVARIGRADVLMIAAPEYAGAIAGALKNALDWLVGFASLYRKPVVVLSAGTTGGEHARRQLIQTLTWQGAHVVGDLGIAAPRTKSDENGRFTDAATIVAIERLTQLAVDAPALADDERLALVHAVVSAAGLETGHIAPAG